MVVVVVVVVIMMNVGLLLSGERGHASEATQAGRCAALPLRVTPQGRLSRPLLALHNRSSDWAGMSSQLSPSLVLLLLPERRLLNRPLTHKKVSAMPENLYVHPPRPYSTSIPGNTRMLSSTMRKVRAARARVRDWFFIVFFFRFVSFSKHETDQAS